jgi:hypothetical protein
MQLHYCRLSSAAFSVNNRRVWPTMYKGSDSNS